MAWGLTTMVIGLLFGWASPFSDDRFQLLHAGTVLGVCFSLGYTMLGVAFHADPLFLRPGFLAGLVAFFLLIALFLVGTWLGDRLERRTRPIPARNSTGSRPRTGDG